MDEKQKSKYATQTAWDKTHTRRYGLKLMMSTDPDIIAYLDGCESVQGEIKRLIRAEIARRNDGD